MSKDLELKNNFDNDYLLKKDFKNRTKNKFWQIHISIFSFTFLSILLSFLVTLFIWNADGVKQIGFIEFLKDSKIKTLYTKNQNLLSQESTLLSSVEKLKLEKKESLKDLRKKYKKERFEIKKNYKTYKEQAPLFRTSTKVFQSESQKINYTYNTKLSSLKKEFSNTQKKRKTNYKEIQERERQLKPITSNQYYLQVLTKKYLNSFYFYKEKYFSLQKVQEAEKETINE